MSEKKMVSGNVAIALGIICIVLIVLIAYFSVTGISAQNSYNNLQSENRQLQTWLIGNETLLSQTQANNTNLQNQVASQNATITSLNSTVESQNATITSLEENVTELQSILNSLQSASTSASTYFAISGQGAFYNPSGSNTSMVLITQLGFYFTPIYGPADNLEMFIQGYYDPASVGWTHVAKGNTTFSGDIFLPYAIPSFKQSDGTYTLNVTLECTEASGVIVLHFTQNELYPS